jgi:O-antigen ligase
MLEIKTRHSDFEGLLLDPGMLAQKIPETGSQMAHLSFLAVLLGFAPLSYGAVHPWAYSLVQLALAGAGCLWLGHWAWALGRAETVTLNLVRTPLHLFILLLTAWIGLQLIPLPMTMVAWLSPKAASIREMGGAAPPAWSSLSLNPFATRLGLVQFFSYAAVFVLTLQALRCQKEITGAILFLGAVGGFEVIYGASQIFAQPQRIWGWKNIYGSMRLGGTFINPDHAAVWLEMVFFLVLGLYLTFKPDSFRDAATTRRDQADWKRRFLDPQTMERYIKRFLVLLLVLILASGLILTQSRGGVWAGAVTLACIFYLERARQKDRAPWTAGLVFLGSLTAYIFLVSGGVDLSHLGDLTGNESRIAMYQGTWAMARDFLLTGVGLGTFQDVFTMYQEPSLINLSVDFAHSDWLQLLAEMGLPGFCLIMGGYLVFVYYLWDCWRRRSDQFARGLGLGCLGAILCVSFHAAVEFPFHIPANCLMLAAVMALGVVAVHFHQHPWERMSYNTIRFFRQMSGRLAILLPLILAGLVLALALPAWNHWAAERLVSTQPDSTRDPSRVEKEDITSATSKSPNNPAYYAMMAEVVEKEIETAQEKGEEPSHIQSLEETCLGLWEQAVRLNPANWLYRLELGSFLVSSTGQDPGVRRQRGLQELQAAIKLFPQLGYPHLYYGEALVDLERDFPQHLSTELKYAAVQELQQAEAKDPQLAPRVNTILESVKSKGP